MKGPRNSIGEPWREGQTWACSACGQSGPDRDDVAFPECRRTGARAAGGAHTALVPSGGSFGSDHAEVAVSASWRDLFRPRIAAIIADARARGLDEKATMRALKNPYKHGWLAQVWSDERARQLGRTTGRLAPREGSPAARRRSVIAGGQIDLIGGGS